MLNQTLNYRKSGNGLVRQSGMVEATAGFGFLIEFVAGENKLFPARKAAAEIIDFGSPFLADGLPARIAFKRFDAADSERFEIWVHQFLLDRKFKN